MKLVKFLSVVAVSVLIGCTPTQEKTEKNNGEKPLTENYQVIADTITYSVLLKNNDPYDTWKENALKHLKREDLTDYLFEGVYKKKLTPIDFFSDQPMTIKEIKELEKSEEFSRDRIARAQFEEIWYFNPQENKMHKQVYSIMIAYEVYNDLGEVKGYKPAFKVFLN